MVKMQINRKYNPIFTDNPLCIRTILGDNNRD